MDLDNSQGGYSDILGFEILNFKILGGLKKKNIIFMGTKIFTNIFGGHLKCDYYFFGLFRKSRILGNLNVSG